MVKIVVKKIIFCIIFGCLGLNVAFADNHQAGLHLQFSSQTIDIKKNQIEEIQIFPTSASHASALIKLSKHLAEKVYMLTEKEMGQDMVFIWNGRVVGVQKIKTPINEFLTIPNLTSFEAEDMSKA